MYVISAILGLSAVVLATNGEIRALLCLMALLIVALLAARVVFLPHLSEEEQKRIKEHSLREELADLEQEVREEAVEKAPETPESPEQEESVRTEKTTDQNRTQ